MLHWFQALDRILRGEATRLSQLSQGPGSLDLPAGGLTVLVVLLGAFHGFCMGWFALFNRDSPEYIQLVAAMIKVPALFLLTLLVTFPSLYVFNALVGSKLRLGSLFRLLIASLGVSLAVLASFGPIVAFFSLTTNNYPFMVLLNVVLFGVAGLLGLTFLIQTLHRLNMLVVHPPLPKSDTQLPPPMPEPTGALEVVEGSVLGKRVKAVFVCWILVFGLVGTQMSWVLRPFIGAPDRPFTWFRPRESYFFEALIRALERLFS